MFIAEPSLPTERKDRAPAEEHVIFKTMNEQSWHLRDAEKLQKENPYTFYKPGEEIISKLEIGDHVRLIFSFEPQAEDGCTAERMWVKIKTLNDGCYEGVLDNSPLYINWLKLGDMVEFLSKHIIDTNYTDPKDKEFDGFSKLCLVTKSVLNGDKVGLLQRFEPNNEKDSGWCFSGDFDTQEYLDNSDNIKIVSLGVVLNMDDSFLHLLEFPIGSSFEWNRTEQKYILFKDEND